jgi:hypothetical protein
MMIGTARVAADVKSFTDTYRTRSGDVVLEMASSM